MIHPVTATVGVRIIIEIVPIVSLLILLILRNISMAKLEDRKVNNNKYPFITGLLGKAKKIREEEKWELSLFVNSSKAFVIPLLYVFLAIILYQIIIIL